MPNPCRSIIAADRNIASGLAIPWPAMSGAEPCTGSNTPGWPSVAQRGAGQHAQRAGQHRRLVAEDVAEHVLGDDHLEVPGRRHELHGRVVDQQVLELDVAGTPRRAARGRPRATAGWSRARWPCRRWSRASARRRTRPGRSARSPRACRRTSSDALSAGPRLLAEVDPAGELADDEHVGALDDLALERAGVVQRRQRLDRAQVGEQPRPLRRPSSPCSGRGWLGSVVSHLGPPTAASSTASAPRQAASVSSVSAVPWASIEAPPNRCSSYSNGPARPRRGPRRRADDLRPDAVAGEEDDAGRPWATGTRSRSMPAGRRARHVQAHVVEHRRGVS